MLMVDWQNLRDIYGSAVEVPNLLEAAASSTQWHAPAWQDLWQRLYQRHVSPDRELAALVGSVG